MTVVHLALAVLAAAVAFGALAAAVGLRLGWRDGRVWADRSILAVVTVVAIDGLLGLALVALGHAPTDLLHVVYGAVALVVLPAGRWAGRSGDLRRRAIWLAGAAAILLGILVRLAQTG